MNHENEMGTKNMFPLILKMALPPMLSMLIQSMYNIIDSIFVARLSADALNAISIIYPLQNLTLSVSVGAGVGLNAYIARNLGAGKRENATAAGRLSLITAGIHYLLLALCICLFMHPFVNSFTSSAVVREYCLEYGYIVILFSFGQFYHINLEKIFQANGKMTIPMILQAVGCITNIVLDPILIFGLGPIAGMGVKGAAIATVIGQLCSCTLGFLFFFMGKTGISMKKVSHHAPYGEMLKQIYGVAIPSTLIIALPSALVAGLNHILASFSALAVSVFGIYYKLQTFVYMPTGGLVQGIRPIIAYNYGAKKHDREISAIRISLLIVGGIMAIGTLLFLCIPDTVLGIFDATDEMKAIGIPALRIISIGFIPSTIGVVGSAVFESIGSGGKSLFITLLRQLLLLLPIAYALSPFLGLSGIWIAFPIAEIITCVVAYFMLRKNNQS